MFIKKNRHINILITTGIAELKSKFALISYEKPCRMDLDK